MFVVQCLVVFPEHQIPVHLFRSHSQSRGAFINWVIGTSPADLKKDRDSGPILG